MGARGVKFMPWENTECVQILQLLLEIKISAKSSNTMKVQGQNPEQPILMILSNTVK